MTEAETNVLNKAHQKVTEALDLLLGEAVQGVKTIREVREIVVNAQNAIGHLLSGDRAPFR